MNNKDCEMIAGLLYNHPPSNISGYFSLDKRIKEHFDIFKEIDDENTSIFERFDTLMREEYHTDYINYSLKRIRPIFPKANEFLKQAIESVMPEEDVEYKLSLCKVSSDYILFLTKE